MASIVRNVRDIESDERRVYESVLGHALGDNQQIVIRVIESVREPDETTRKAALGRVAAIARQGRTAAAGRVSETEIDAAVEEAMAHVRRRKS